ncbi:unnamed protein product [Ectocarpus sp. 12 AP-2014]
MVYQRTASPAQSSSRRGSRERCLGCGYGLGQFQVEYASNDDDGLGRGYCSLDCYTSAKVTGRAMQHQSRARGGGSDGQHWGGGACTATGTSRRSRSRYRGRRGSSWTRRRSRSRGVALRSCPGGSNGTWAGPRRCSRAAARGPLASALPGTTPLRRSRPWRTGKRSTAKTGRRVSAAAAGSGGSALRVAAAAGPRR